MTPRTRRTLICTLLGSVSVAAYGAGRTAPVSPGSTTEIPKVAARCPTFSWSAAAESADVELAVYRLGVDSPGAFGHADTVEPVIHVTIAGGARAWTPPSDLCLAGGSRYAWVVRAQSAEDAPEWSDPRFFEIERLSAVEVSEAVEVLRSYLDQAEFEGARAERRAEEAPRIDSGGPAVAEAASRAGALAGLTGTAAIRGERPDATGEAYGVVGISNSPDGAGLVADNAAAGADLVLHGDDTSPDARLTESSLARESDDDQTFDFVNPGGGEITLQVAGIAVVTTATDQDSLGTLSCASGEIAKWNGAAWECSVDDAPDTLAGLSCGGGEIVRWNGAAWECSTDLDTLGTLSCADTQVAQWNGAAWVCANVGTDTLASLSCDPGQVVHWNGAVWTCGQPTLTRLTCSDSGSPASCTMSCPAGTVVWTGGCASGTSHSLTDNTPTEGGGVPTGWRCEAWNPLGTATVDGELYCVAQ